MSNWLRSTLRPARVLALVAALVVTTFVAGSATTTAVAGKKPLSLTASATAVEFDTPITLTVAAPGLDAGAHVWLVAQGAPDVVLRTWTVRQRITSWTYQVKQTLKPTRYFVFTDDKVDGSRPQDLVDVGLATTSSLDAALPGEPFTISMRMPTAQVRPVVLRAGTPNGGMSQVQSGWVDASGRISFTVRQQSVTRYNLYFPSYEHATAGELSSFYSSPVTVAVADQSVTLAVPETAHWGDDIVATSTITPYRAGRELLLQQYDDQLGDWVQIGRAAVDAAGRVDWLLPQRPSDSTTTVVKRLRVIAESYRGSSTVTSEERAMTVSPIPTATATVTVTVSPTPTYAPPTYVPPVDSSPTDPVSAPPPPCASGYYWDGTSCTPVG